MKVSNLVYDKVDNFKFVYDGLNVELPNEVRVDIEKNWNELIKSGKKYFNGQLFTVKDIVLNDDILEFRVGKSNFAHWIHSRKNDWYGEYSCKSVATSSLLVTNDDFYVLCRMANDTCLGGKIKFIGGAMDVNDILNNEIMPKNCAKREVLEEVGLDLNDTNKIKKIEQVYFSTRKNLSFINVFYKVYLNMSSKDLLSFFKAHDEYLKKNNMERELHSIVCIKNDKDEVLKFIGENKNYTIDYLEDVFKVELGLEIPRKFSGEENKI